MFRGEINALALLYFAKIGGCMYAVGVCGYEYIREYPWIYPWISTENLWIWIWIWIGNFISTVSLEIADLLDNKLTDQVSRHENANRKVAKKAY